MNLNHDNITNDDEELPLVRQFQAQALISYRPQVREFKPNKDILALCPSLDKRDFYKPSKDIDEAIDSDDDESFDTMASQWPKNKTIIYTAPPVTSLQWPHKSKDRQYADNDLAAIQGKMAHLSRPLDEFMVNILSDERIPPDLLEAQLEWAESYQAFIQKASENVGDMRVKNLQRALGMDALVKKNNRKDLLDSSTILEQKKLILSVQRNVYRKNNWNNYNNNRSYSNNRPQHYNDNTSSSRQDNKSSG